MADLVSRNLSSATKAVVVAFTNDPDRMKMCEEERVSLAAALRAAADHDPDGNTTDEYDTGWRAAMGFIDAIADELEAQ